MRRLAIVTACVALGGCAIQLTPEAQDARAQMVGMSKEQVSACMGAPANKVAEGTTEVWGYTANNGATVVNASYDHVAGTAGASPFCNINVVFTGNQVSGVNYTGPTGDTLTQGEQCAHAVDACTNRGG